MGKVQYNQKGYVGVSMPKRATYAYDKAEETIAHLTALLEEAMNEAKKG